MCLLSELQIASRSLFEARSDLTVQRFPTNNWGFSRLQWDAQLKTTNQMEKTMQCLWSESWIGRTTTFPNCYTLLLKNKCVFWFDNASVTVCLGTGTTMSWWGFFICIISKVLQYMSHHVQITCTVCELTLMLEAGGDGGGMHDSQDVLSFISVKPMDILNMMSGQFQQFLWRQNQVFKARTWCFLNPNRVFFVSFTIINMLSSRPVARIIC